MSTLESFNTRLRSPRTWRMELDVEQAASGAGEDCPDEPQTGRNGSPETATRRVPGEVLARISTGLVQLHRSYYGKGPTKAKTYLMNDSLICILKGGFTTVEQTLIESGDVNAVYSIRRSFQDAMKDRFTTVVEDATGRKVIAYMSQIHHDPDLAVEIFILEPTDDKPVGELEQELAED